MRMCDDQRIKGWWYLPPYPQERVPGILTWNQNDGVELELIGGFRQPLFEPPAPEASGQSKVEAARGTIYGETVAGKLVTLWEAELGNTTENFQHDPIEQFWHAPWLCVGAHLPAANESPFRQVALKLDYLYDLTLDGRLSAPKWARFEGVESPGEEQEDGSLVLPYIVPVVGGLKNDLGTGSTAFATYSIDTYASGPMISPASEQFPELKLASMTKQTRGGTILKVSVDARARIKPRNSAFSPLEIPARISPLRELVSIATYASSGVSSMSAMTMDDQDVSLFCRLGASSNPGAPLRARQIIFTLQDVSLERFLEVRQRMTANDQALYAWNVVVGLIGHSPLMVEEHVSQVLAAAEGFQRWCLGGARNTTLEKRLVKLYDRLPESVRTKMALDVDKWANWSVWARNHVAHGGAQEHREVDDFYQLKVIADSVRLITYLVLLTELRVPEPKIADALLNHPELEVLRRRCLELDELPATPTEED